MFVYVTFTIEGGELGKDAAAFRTSPADHRPVDGTAVDEDGIDAQAVEAVALLP